jgi:hypothetical protein
VRNPDEAQVAQLAYETSLRALTQQEASLNEIRSRAGTLLAASSIVASFLGGQALTNHSVGWLGVVALIAFGVSILACLWVLLPKDNLIFSLSGSVLYETEQEDAAGIVETHRRLAYWLEGYRTENNVTIRYLFWGYRAATFGVIIQVGAWAIRLATM